MKPMIRILLSLTVLFGAMAAGAEHFGERLGDLELPDGWIKSEEQKQYDNETLFNYINGESEVFFPYGFQRLTVFHLMPMTSPEEKVEVQIYEMGSSLGAFGIYSTYRTPQEEFVNIGSEGFIGTTQVVFWQQNCFVKMHYVQPRGDRQLLLDLAQSVSNGLPEAGEEPDALALVQVPGLKPKTIRYEARSLMGYSFFPQGIQAEVAVETSGDEAAEISRRVTIVICDSPEAAQEAMEKYAGDLGFFNAEFHWDEQEMGKVLAVTNPPFERTAALRSGRYVVLVSTTPDLPAAPYTLLERLHENIEAQQG